MAAANYYTAAFNATTLNAQSSLGTITFTKSGNTPFAITLGTLQGPDSTSANSSYFWHAQTSAAFSTKGTDINATTRLPHYSTISWGRAFQNAVNAAMTANGWPTSDFLVEWLEQDGSGNPVPFYRFSYGSSFSIQFSTEAGARMFGRNSTALVGPASSFTLGTPSYCVFPSTMQGISCTAELKAINYHPQGHHSLVVSDTGVGYGNARFAGYKDRDWRHFGLPASVVYREHSSSPLETFEHVLYEYCPGNFPFCVANGNFGSPFNYEIFDPRDQMVFDPVFLAVGFLNGLHLDFRTTVVGHWVSVS